MKLSDAIRLGAMLKPQGRGCLEMNGHSCALGAALDAIGHLGHQYGGQILREHWPYLETEVCGPLRLMGRLYRVIVDLNDDHGWTREQIADWVATVEPHVAQPETQAVTA